MESRSQVPRRLKSLTHIGGPVVKWIDRDLINFCSNDYLGLKEHSLIKQGAIDFIERFGCGSGASRLVSGTYDYHLDLEKKLATSMGFEAAVVMNSGFQTNISLLSTLADRDSLLLLDRECHNSLIQGAFLSRAKCKRFQHQDFSQLRTFLQDAKEKKIFIVTESLFSMDGDWTDLEKFLELKKEFKAFLIVDDSHGVGVRSEPIPNGIDLVVSSFGKAFGCFGSFLLCSNAICFELIQKCSGLIYSTALPPMVIGAVNAALDLLPRLEKERGHLLTLSCYLRKILNKRGFDTGASDSHIIPIILRDEEMAIDLEKKITQNGVLASAIRPPTVRQSRIRLSLTALHTQSMVDCLLEGLWS